MTRSDIASAEVAATFSCAPLLDAFENFQGSFFDLDLGVRISAGALKKLRKEFCKQMQGFGLEAGDRLLAALPNGALFAAGWAASLEAGASPILVHSETPAPELTRMAERWGARFVVHSQTAVESGESAGESLRAGEQGTLAWRKGKEADSMGDRLRLLSVPLHPTSGTSGGPKIAVRPGPCAVAEPQHYIETLSIDKSDVILCALPMSHAYAYGMCSLVTLLTSAQLLFMRRFNPVLVQNALNEMDISIFPAVPFMLDSLLAMQAGPVMGLPRAVLSAGMPLTRKTFEDFRARYSLSIRPLYGTTETGGISIGPAENHFEGSVGFPMKGVEVDLRASSDGSFGPNTGVVRVRSSSLMSGYLESDGVDRNAVLDGWFETGDLGRMDKRGKIHLQGRLSEVINVFGYKVVPREVEEVILLLPEVSEVKVYAGRHLGPDIVEAAVVRRGPLDEAEIIKHCEKHLVGYKCPTAIRFVDSLPRTASGKIAIERLSE